jgi:hypothetical protein
VDEVIPFISEVGFPIVVTLLPALSDWDKVECDSDVDSNLAGEIERTIK